MVLIVVDVSNVEVLPVVTDVVATVVCGIFLVVERIDVVRDLKKIFLTDPVTLVGDDKVGMFCI